MVEITENGGGRRGSYWRIAAWAAATLLLLLPLVAMQFSDEVNWSMADFAFAAVLLFGSLGAYELAVRKTGDTAYRGAIGLALAAAFLLIWMIGAVGLIGSEDNDANLMYYGVLAVGLIGAFVARFQPQGMARAMLATALAQALVTLIAVIAGWGLPWSPPMEILGINGFFVALWLIAARLFGNVARDRTERDAA